MPKFVLLSIFVAGLFAPIPAFSQTIPGALLRPVTGEAPRYPRDVVIGALGQGEAPDGAWQYARRLMDALITGNRTGLEANDGELLAPSLESLGTVNPIKYNIGGGRTEEDGAVSFLVRFLGREQWMTGELYLRFEGEAWQLDDLVLEEGRGFEEENAYPYDFSPYERFF